MAPKGTPGGLAGIIQNEKRAVTVKVDEASGVAGFVMPGNWVDVLLTMERNDFKDDPMSQAVLENILVLGRGQDLEEPKTDEKPKIVPTVTLEVTPRRGARWPWLLKRVLLPWLCGAVLNQPRLDQHVRTSTLLRGGKKPEPAFETPIAPAAPLPKNPASRFSGVLTGRS